MTLFSAIAVSHIALDQQKLMVPILVCSLQFLIYDYDSYYYRLLTSERGTKRRPQCVSNVVLRVLIISSYLCGRD